MVFVSESIISVVIIMANKHENCGIKIIAFDVVTPSLLSVSLLLFVFVPVYIVTSSTVVAN